MKYISQTLLACLAIASFSSCASNVGGTYGQRSVAINEGRSDPHALTSAARFNQNRTQRQNELEEARTQRELRYHARDAMLSPLKTASEAMSLARGMGLRL